MKRNLLMFAWLLPITLFSISHSVTAQDSTAISYESDARVDSLVKAYNQQEAVQDKHREESENLSDLKSQKQEAQGKAKEAQRVEADANDAAKESKMAYRKEKKAQRFREQADRQAERAEGARNKSDKN